VDENKRGSLGRSVFRRGREKKPQRSRDSIERRARVRVRLRGCGCKRQGGKRQFARHLSQTAQAPASARTKGRDLGAYLESPPEWEEQKKGAISKKARAIIQNMSA